MIKNLNEASGKEVTLKGWVYQFRSSGKIAFLVLRDGSGECQCVFSSEKSKEDSLLEFRKLTLETLVRVKGVVKPWKDTFEIEGRELEILSLSEPYPLGKKSHGVDFLLNHRHLWLRSKRQKAILHIRNELIRQCHLFFEKSGFLKIDAPILTPTSCEGTSSLFSVDFFKEKSMFLSQSGQLYMEAATAAFGKVYCFGPTFRAEKSSTRRHLLEFWMLEPEMAFYSLEDAMTLSENFLSEVISGVLKTHEDHFKILGRDPTPLKKISPPFPRLTYEEASKKLNSLNPEFEPGKDLGGPDETLLSSEFEKPVFVHRYPENIKAFYMKRDPKNPKLSLSFDLLASEGYGEVIGGGEREDSLSLLKERIQKHGLENSDLNWYLDLRRFGSFPHSGFGLGLERLVTWVCGLDHVRESIPFPRLYGRNFFEETS